MIAVATKRATETPPVPRPWPSATFAHCPLRTAHWQKALCHRLRRVILDPTILPNQQPAARDQTIVMVGFPERKAQLSLVCKEPQYSSRVVSTSALRVCRQNTYSALRLHKSRISAVLQNKATMSTLQWPSNNWIGCPELVSSGFPIASASS